MDCARIRAALSASLDGEDPGIPEHLLTAHLRTCAGCRTFADEAGALHRAIRVQPAVPVPDLTARILERLPRPAADPRTVGLRICLAVIGVVQLAGAVPELMLGTAGGTSVHGARHAGAFGVALGVGLLAAAWRPSRSAGILTVTAVLVACLGGAMLADLAAGRTTLVNEASHTNEFIGVAVLWMLQRRRPQPAGRLRVA